MENEPSTTKVWASLVIGILAFIPDYIVGATLDVRRTEGQRLRQSALLRNISPISQNLGIQKSPAENFQQAF